jgi:hypothetical protein
MKTFVMGALAGFGLFAALPADAAIIQVGSRAALGATATLDWSAFGPTGTDLSCACTVTAPGTGQQFFANGTSGLLYLRTEGTNYTGGFTAGANVVIQPYLSDQFSLGFAGPVHAVGFDAEAFDSLSSGLTTMGYGGAYTVTLRAYDSPSVLLGTATVSGTGGSPAPFLGVVDTTGFIDYITLSVSTAFPGFPTSGNVTIDDVSYAADEPGGLAVVPIAAGILLAVIARRRIRGRAID